MKTCLMQQTTTIASEGFVVSPSDSSVEGIDFFFNKKIQFLPIQVDETFPNLVIYDAGLCSIKVVAKNSFKNLTKLERLYLQYNKIELIDFGTFGDLTSLKILWLSSYKLLIKSEMLTSLLKFQFYRQQQNQENWSSFQ